MRKTKIIKKRIKSIEKTPHDPRQCTVVDILREKVRHRDVRAMTVLGLYYAYGIGCQRQIYHAACLFENAYSHTNDSEPAYRSQADICSLAGKLILDSAVLRSVDQDFADEIKAGQEQEQELENEPVLNL